MTQYTNGQFVHTVTAKALQVLDSEVRKEKTQITNLTSQVSQNTADIADLKNGGGSGGNTNPFKDKWISIIGDSISTFKDFSLGATYKEGNAGDIYYPNVSDTDTQRVQSVKDTWWYKVIKSLGANLCVNTSWNGRKAIDSIYNDKEKTARSKTSFDPILHSGDKYFTFDDTDKGYTEATATEDIVPDIVIIMLGVNDFAEASINHSKLSALNYSVTEDGYKNRILSPADGEDATIKVATPYALPNYYMYYWDTEDKDYIPSNEIKKNSFNYGFAKCLMSLAATTRFSQKNKRTQFFVCGLMYNNTANYGQYNNVFNNRHTYNVVMEDITKWNQMSFIDLEGLNWWKTNDNITSYMEDTACIHPNKRGMDMLAQRIESSIRQQYVDPTRIDNV